MVGRHLTLDFQMVCLTDDSTGIIEGGAVLPDTRMGCEKRNQYADLPAGKSLSLSCMILKAWRPFLDIDIVIVDNIDNFLLIRQEFDDSVVIIRDWGKNMAHDW